MIEIIKQLLVLRIAPAESRLPTPVLQTVVHLVIAAIKGYARVVAQALELPICLITHILQKSLITGIGIAGEHEILPHQQAQFIAIVVKGVILVNTATPNPDHVHVDLRSIMEQTVIHIASLRRIQRARIRGCRNPVCTAGKEGFAVDLECERLSNTVLLAHQLHRSQSMTDGPLIGLLLIHYSHGIGVQMLPAHAIGPPKLGMSDGHRYLDEILIIVQLDALFNLGTETVFIKHLNLNRTFFLLFERFYEHLHISFPSSRGIKARFRVTHINIFQLQIAETLQADILPNATGDELRAPIPSRHILRFAGKHAVVGKLIRQLFCLNLFKLIYWEKLNNQFIILLFQDIIHTKTPSAEHIVQKSCIVLIHGAQFLPVEPHLSVGVKPVKDKPVVLVRLFHTCTIRIENEPIGPHAISYPLHRILIGAKERIWNQTVGQQVGVDVAGHRGGIPLPLILELPVVRIASRLGFEALHACSRHLVRLATQKQNRDKSYEEGYS